ncbi:putative spermidine/putrescine transport system ATP-binding protein [Roseinatronobacter thiooxidans]|uniref:Putative spermidine/putrescine transport system ATP-binding protein n=1 Tax=Roseinatronobacter thiooxidans TaxID=121821 RepID=A0A2W7PLD7_9RHOB|nr:putative spermidine/putrescine transport system ATP-binding protein [Roseinatronobacter thiooxidans]
MTLLSRSEVPAAQAQDRAPLQNTDSATAPVSLSQAGLVLRRISHSFSGTPALRDVGFDVGAGQVVALLGPSGCGKSTLLRAIAGLLVPDRGEIFLDGQNLMSIPARKRSIGMVFQNYALFPHLTVAENVAYGLISHRRPRAEVNARVSEMLRLVRLEDYARRLPRELSGGQQQRVAVARALAVSPAALLLDEPFGALDRALRTELQDEFVRMQADVGITTIMVTHDQEEAQTVADTLVVMNAGRVEQVGSPEDIYDRPASLFVNRFMGHANCFSAKVTGAHTAALAAGPTVTSARGFAFRPGSDVILTARPEHVRLVAQNDAGAISAKWVRAAPLAHMLSVDLITPDGTLIKALVNRHDGPRYAPGDAVGILLDTQNLHVFPAASKT